MKIMHERRKDRRKGEEFLDEEVQRKLMVHGLFLVFFFSVLWCNSECFGGDNEHMFQWRELYDR